MAKNNILKAVAGVVLTTAAVGGALAYIKKCKDVNDLSEEDFDDLLDDEEECECSAERTYTTLPTEDVHETDCSGEAEEEAVESESQAAEEVDSEEAEEENKESVGTTEAEEEVADATEKIDDSEVPAEETEEKEEA